MTDAAMDESLTTMLTLFVLHFCGTVVALAIVGINGREESDAGE